MLAGPALRPGPCGPAGIRWDLTAWISRYRQAVMHAISSFPGFRARR